MSIRSIYESIGVEAFYSGVMRYENPHAREVDALIRAHHLALPLENVLDLACGNGLVTSSLQALGHFDVIGLDPFRSEEYTARTGRPSYRMSFKDIVNDGLPHDFSCIICSFAMHLCQQSMLPDLLWRLSERSNTLVVISPTKFPIIGKPVVEDVCWTANNKRIQFRRYNLPLFPNS
ncbi:class I SAM-dependent methyltransferase [Candidatus Pacearchaeota archaeon]|nr:class I SAM-dependent methyltransferase [Candidatus Pacearchaeota archaeon]